MDKELFDELKESANQALEHAQGKRTDLRTTVLPKPLAKMKGKEVGKSSSPRDVLAFLMEQHELKQKDLVDIFSSSGTISQELSGAREISKAQAKALGEKFRVSAELFI
jgi:HTH-type transcriptional regulator/antitoxin HigA